ncbi:uncharacterized protein LOC129796132 [Lutzomyia longipalpis]|uniref:uncharacterized protein LOC129788326 n=1 Tax=Lutzomyia longipalpis TaxID=7200 RepID=UPI00248444C0|nr:uncharacterized protein LOC129788326 [Lutzomyia longipalpis]XP_055693861.1 uncharacterized protein LOC129796132 [Lutzomyia longipalpis]
MCDANEKDDICKIRDALKRIGSESYLHYFIDQEYSFEAFKCLSLEICKEFIPKSGPRLIFFKKYSSLIEEFDGSTRTNVDSCPIQEILEFTNATEVPSNVGIPEGSSSIGNPVDDFANEFLSCARGFFLKGKYTKNNTFSDSERAKLAKLLVEKEFSSWQNVHGDASVLKFKISSQRFQELAKLIEQTFPGENSLTYFIPYNKITKSSPSGKLYWQYNNWRQALKDIVPQASTEIEDFEVDDHLKFLRENTEPWDEIFFSWRATFHARQKLLKSPTSSLQNYFNQFKILQSPCGNDLLLKDFSTEYPDCDTKFFERWPEINERIISFCKKKISKDEFDYLDRSTPYELLGFFALPKLLKGSYLSKTVERNKKLKLTQTEVLKRLILHVQDASLLERKINEENLYYDKHKLKRTPKLIFVGSDFNNISSVFIEVGGTYYEQSSALSGIDSFFKTVVALNSEFPEGAQVCWSLVQHYVYELHTEKDKSYVSVSSLISDLQNAMF